MKLIHLAVKIQKKQKGDIYRGLELKLIHLEVHEPFLLCCSRIHIQWQVVHEQPRVRFDELV
jgi:hypothetical protein